MAKRYADMQDLVPLVVSAFPKLEPEEQLVSRSLYQLLAEGRPVAVDAIAYSVGIPSERVDAILTGWPGVFYDDQARVVGYWGLTLETMRHRFFVDDHELYTWCAWDSLLIPQLVGRNARVDSVCPITGRSIRLDVSAAGVQSLDPATAVMSIVTPDAASVIENVVANFCHFVFFLASIEAGQLWLEQNPSGALITVEDAFELGRLKNEAQYLEILGDRRAQIGAL